MNERIKLLADQAELTIHTGRGNTYMSHPEFNKKFAELILQDVLKIVDGKELLPYFDAHVESEPEDPVGKGWWRKQETIKRVIKERYGVE